MAKPPTLREPPFGPLELAVLDALAWELRPEFPDLAAQLDAAEPGRRTNTGGGFYNVLNLPRLRGAGAGRKATGLYGSVHAMVSGLPDAVGFQLQLRDGRPMALMADAYDQDTRGLDFRKARFDQLFYLDAQGRSHPYTRSLSNTQSRADARDQRTPQPQSQAPRPQSPQAVFAGLAVPGTAAAPIDTSAWTGPAETRSAFSDAAPAPPAAAVIHLGVWVAIVVVVLVLTASGLPFIALAIGGGFLGRWLTSPPMIRQIQQQLAGSGALSP